MLSPSQISASIKFGFNCLTSIQYKAIALAYTVTYTFQHQIKSGLLIITIF